MYVDLLVKINCKVPSVGLGKAIEVYVCGNYGRSVATTHVDTSAELVIDVSMSVRWSV